ncbi:hypothetical protein N8I77_008435 [Diaporthe amygdali]|uniref:Uncharacterized protein n=1 Tax=Phomopsis amygdali TaxID=1214568 RepID=A0AAD9SDB2_PHOAM|nr:hypothetical protein N8I77_008435 [Diaporthe amygdali]
MAKDIRPDDIGHGRDAQSPEDAEKRTKQYLSNSTLYPNGKLKLDGKMDIVKQRFEDFRVKAKGIPPKPHFFLAHQIHLAEDKRFWLIGRRDGFDQVQYINPNGKERDGHAGMSMIHIMGIPRNDPKRDGSLSREPIYNGVSLHAKNADVLEHMKKTFKYWWEKEPNKRTRKNIIGAQARAIVWKFKEDVKALGNKDGVDAQTKADNAKKGVQGEYQGGAELLDQVEEIQEKSCISTAEFRYEDLHRWDRFLGLLCMHLRGRAQVKKNPKLSPSVLGWQHPVNRLLKAHESYKLLSKYEEENVIRFEDFDFALHLRPDNSVDYLHMHIFLWPARYRIYSCVIWDPLYKSIVEVAKVAMQYPGPVGETAGSSGSNKQQQPGQAKQLPWGFEEPDNKDAQIKALKHRIEVLEQYCKAKGIGLPQDQAAAKAQPQQARTATSSAAKPVTQSGHGNVASKGSQQQTAVRSDAKKATHTTKAAGQAGSATATR